MSDKLLAWKGLHAASACFVLAVAALSAWMLPDLFQGVVTRFATVTGYVTVYGLLFAVVEVLRTKSVAQVASDEARRAHDEVTRLYGAREISECQSFIETAIQAIDQDATAAFSLMPRITKAYCSVFATQYQDPTSEHRRHVMMIESYVGAAHTSKASNTGNIKKSLISMMAQLSLAAQPQAIEEL